MTFEQPYPITIRVTLTEPEAMALWTHCCNSRHPNCKAAQEKIYKALDRRGVFNASLPERSETEGLASTP